MRSRSIMQLLPFVTVVAGSASVARAQVATALLREGDALAGAPAGQIVTAISNTAGNRANGFAATINSSDGVTTLSHAWGSANGGAGALLLTELTATAGYTQTSWETFFGMDDSGNVGYSPLANDLSSGATGLDAVWVGATPIATEGQAITTIPGRVFRFNSRPGMTGTGTIYWVGGINDTGGVNFGQGLFVGAGQTCLLKTGDPSPAPLTSTLGSTAVDFDVRMSAAGTHWITNIQTTDPAASDTHLVIDGAIALDAGGARLSEGVAVSAAAGGIGGELWQNWSLLGIDEAGDWMVCGDTSGAVATDAFVVKNGAIVHREGDVLGGLTLVGAPSGAFMNESGEIALVWDTTGSIEALFLENSLLLKEGDNVDWDGDGTPDATATLLDFTGITALTTSTSGGGTTTSVLFTADVNVGGTTLEGFFRIEIAGSSGPFCAGDGVDPAVTTPCPCANVGALGHGCANSVNGAGALLALSGTTNPDTAVLNASGMPATVTCIYLQGDATGDQPFGDGVRCADGVLTRSRSRRAAASRPARARCASTRPTTATRRRRSARRRRST